MNTRHEQIEDLLFLAEVYGWKFREHNLVTRHLSFKKSGCGMLIYYKECNDVNVTTSMVHPRKGTTEMHRKNVDMEMLEALLDNPRLHTTKGFLKKKTTPRLLKIRKKYTSYK